MKIKFANCLFVILASGAFANSLWAQDRITTDGLLFIDSGPLSHALSPQPNAATEGTEASRARATPRLKRPLIQNFDHRPAPVWEPWDCGDGVGKAGVSHGILTIDAASCYEFMLFHPNGKWHEFVDNSRGWVIETSLKVDPRNPAEECNDNPGTSLKIWVHDHTNLVIFGFTTDEVCIAYPDNVRLSMDTTNAFHVYRIESKRRSVRVFVDGNLKIDHTLTWQGGGSDALTFGDGHVNGKTRSYWDYFSYDVFP